MERFRRLNEASETTQLCSGGVISAGIWVIAGPAGTLTTMIWLLLLMVPTTAIRIALSIRLLKAMEVKMSLLLIILIVFFVFGGGGYYGYRSGYYGGRSFGGGFSLIFLLLLLFLLFGRG